MVDCICLVCQAPFSIPEAWARRGQGKYCGLECSRRRARPTPDERYWSYVDRTTTPDGCWPWTGGLTIDGYGGFSPDRLHKVPAHRFGYVLQVGPIPEGHGVLHTCDNRPCQRGAHLFTGTALDNNRDAKAKGRTRNGSRTKPESLQRGASHHKAKLNDTLVREIRLGAEQGVSASTLARRYGISDTNVRHIISRDTWRHVS